MSYWRESADGGGAVRSVARREQVRVLPAWTSQTSFGRRIMAFAPPERMWVRRNQVLLVLRRQQLAP